MQETSCNKRSAKVTSHRQKLRKRTNHQGNFLFPLLVVFAFPQDWCSQLLRRRLQFGIAEKLLATDGANWDYCGKDELLSAMQETVQTLHDNKGVDSDKQRHPLFLGLCRSRPGQVQIPHRIAVPRRAMSSKHQKPQIQPETIGFSAYLRKWHPAWRLADCKN